MASNEHPVWRSHDQEAKIGVAGVISRKFSVGEIATTSPVVARNDYL
jgi:hypothetical protein